MPPRGPQDAPERPPRGPKRPPRGPKEAPRGPKTAPQKPPNCLPQAPERILTTTAILPPPCPPNHPVPGGQIPRNFRGFSQCSSLGAAGRFGGSLRGARPALKHFVHTTGLFRLK